MKSFLKYNWPSLLWAAVIMVLCMMPGRHLPKVHIPHFDKIVHTTLYIICAILTCYGWIRQTVAPGLRRHTFMKVVLLLAAYGLMIEVMQETLTSDRHFEWLDEAANAFGAILGTCLYRYTGISKYNLF